MDNQQAQTFADNVLADEQAMEQYVDELIKEKNSPYVTEANIQEVKDELMDSLSESLNQKMIDELSDEQVQQLNDLLDKNVSDEELSQFFTQCIPNLSQLVSQVLLDFRAGYLNIAVEQPKEEEITTAIREQLSSIVNEQVSQSDTSVQSQPPMDDFISAPPAPVSNMPPVLPPAPVAMEDKKIH